MAGGEEVRDLAKLAAHPGLGLEAMDGAVAGLTARCGGLALTQDVEGGGFVIPGSKAAAGRGGGRIPSRNGSGEENSARAGGSDFAAYVTVRMWRDFSPKTLEKAMTSAWTPLGRMVMTIVEENLFLFRFDHKPDLMKVLREGPWRFNDHPLAVQEAKFGQRVRREELVMVPYWIQVFNVPPFYQTADFMEYVGSKISKEVLAVDATVRQLTGFPKPFMRVRVPINTAQRIPRGTSVRDGDEEIPLAFKFERLYNFCSLCGLVDHVMEDCMEPITEETDVNNPPYGEWLRGIPPRVPTWQQQGFRRETEKLSGNPFMVTSTPRRFGLPQMTPVPTIKAWKEPARIEQPPGFNVSTFDPGAHQPKKTYVRYNRAEEGEDGAGKQSLKKRLAEDMETNQDEEDGGQTGSGSKDESAWEARFLRGILSQSAVRSFS